MAMAESDVSGSESHPLRPRAAYNMLAVHYDQWHWQRFWRENEAPLVAKWFPRATRPLAALDAGCGTGFYLKLMRDRGFRTTGLDISENMLAVARTRLTGSANLVQGDVSSLPVRSRSHDIMLIARVLTHVGDLRAAMREAARVIKVGGFLIVTDIHPEHDYPATRIPVNGRFIYVDTFKWTPQEVIAEAQAAGCHFKQGRRLTAKNLRWLPDNDPAFRNLDRSGSRPVSHLMLFRRSSVTKGLALRKGR